MQSLSYLHQTDIYLSKQLHVTDKTTTFDAAEINFFLFINNNNFIIAIIIIN